MLKWIEVDCTVALKVVPILGHPMEGPYSGSERPHLGLDGPHVYGAPLCHNEFYYFPRFWSDEFVEATNF